MPEGWVKVGGAFKCLPVNTFLVVYRLIYKKYIVTEKLEMQKILSNLLTKVITVGMLVHTPQYFSTQGN